MPAESAGPRGAGYTAGSRQASYKSLAAPCMEFRLPQMCQSTNLGPCFDGSPKAAATSSPEKGDVERGRKPSMSRDGYEKVSMGSERIAQGSRGRRCCGWCFLLTVFALLAACGYGGYLFFTDSLPENGSDHWFQMLADFASPFAGHAEGPAEESVHSSPPHNGTFECEAKSSSEAEGWHMNRRNYCCQQKSWGCPTLYSCDYETKQERAEWVVNRREWCCEMQGKGCPQAPTARPTTTTTATATTTERTTPPPRFDCAYALDRRETEWSEEKKEWCCKRDAATCPASTPPPPPPMHFDCKAEGVWHENHRKWCCQQEGEGCYLCGKGSPVYWQPAKRGWCCEHQHKGCVDVAITTKKPAAQPQEAIPITTPPPSTTSYTGPEGGFQVLKDQVSGLFR